MDSLSSDSEEKLKELDEECDDENDILKKKISSHPLYRLLVESHIDCLKAGAIDELEIMNERIHLKQQENVPSLGMPKNSELDHFMKAYCSALIKLKDAIEEPQQKSMAFIKSMHFQLTELTRSSTHPDESATLFWLDEIKKRMRIRDQDFDCKVQIAQGKPGSYVFLTH